jgi:hypothetical protein
MYTTWYAGGLQVTALNGSKRTRGNSMPQHHMHQQQHAAASMDGTPQELAYSSATSCLLQQSTRTRWQATQNKHTHQQQ